MKVAINAVSAKRGGAVTYMQNMLPVLRARLGAPDRTQVVVWRTDTQTGDEAWPQGIEYRRDSAGNGARAAVGGIVGRLWFDQVELPRVLRSEGFDTLFSSANFGPLRTSARHVILVRNPIYFDPVFMSRVDDVKVRAYHTMQRLLTLQCIERADVVLFPTRAMMDLVAAHTKGPRASWRVAPYGTRHDLFAGSPERRAASDVVELLNVSLYCDQKDFGTLLGAVELLQSASRRFRLKLTAGFHQDWLAESPYFPHFGEEREIYRRLSARGLASDTDWRKYGSLPALYRSADIFVFPSYTESFGHPLVEAMAAGLPVVAADTACNREICGDAAVYFPAFNARACAEAIERVSREPELAARLRERGLSRAQEFTWDRHVDVLFPAVLPD